jgi:regulatory protein
VGADSPVTVRTAALHLLSRRDYTTAELRRKLLDREYPEADIDDAIARLASAGLLDDRRVALAHVRTATAIKGRGRLRIKRELEARGVDRTLVRELVAGIPAADDLAAIERFLARKRLPARPSPSDRRRIFQQLIRRGFPADAILKALRARGASPEDE